MSTLLPLPNDRVRGSDKALADLQLDVHAQVRYEDRVVFPLNFPGGL